MSADLDLADLAVQRRDRVEARALLIASQVSDGESVTLGKGPGAVEYWVTTARARVSRKLGPTPVQEPDVPVLVRTVTEGGTRISTSLVDLARDVPVWDEFKEIINLERGFRRPRYLERPTEVDFEEAALDLNVLEAEFLEIVECNGRRGETLGAIEHHADGGPGGGMEMS